MSWCISIFHYLFWHLQRWRNKSVMSCIYNTPRPPSVVVSSSALSICNWITHLMVNFIPSVRFFISTIGERAGCSWFIYRSELKEKSVMNNWVFTFWTTFKCPYHLQMPSEPLLLLLYTPFRWTTIYTFLRFWQIWNNYIDVSYTDQELFEPYPLRVIIAGSMEIWLSQSTLFLIKILIKLQYRHCFQAFPIKSSVNQYRCHQPNINKKIPHLRWKRLSPPLILNASHLTSEYTIDADRQRPVSRV